MAIDQFQEKLDSRTIQYGEEGRVDKTRVFDCPRSTMDTHRPKVGDYYGKAPVEQGGAEIEGPTDVLCKTVDIANFGDQGATGTVVITATYSNHHEDTTSSGEDGDDQTGDEGGGGVGETTEFSLNFTTEFDMDYSGKDKDGKRTLKSLVRRPKAVLHVVMRKTQRMDFFDIQPLAGKLNSTNFLGAGVEEVMFDNCTIRKEGEYWVHEFDFIYLSMKKDDGTQMNWNTADVGNNKYSRGELNKLGISLN